MAPHKSHNRWLIWSGFVVALLLAVYPLAPENRWLRPELVALLVIYWVIVLPQYISISMLWVVGLAQDIIEGSLLGQHALALMAVVYVCLLTYQRLRNYDLWHQALIVFLIVGIHQLIDNWVHSLEGNAANSLAFLMPALSSALVWPLLYRLLERWRIQYRVS